jgi:methylated-DNA-protein-cysteine methyltransferase-like protein
MANIAALANPQAFMELVWEIVRQIPAGQVSTFGQIASMIPPPDGFDEQSYARLGPRFVGDAMNAVSWRDDPNVPWHRVINAKGTISLPPDTPAAALQRARLRHEGAFAPDAESADLNRVGWEGPPQAWLDEHGLRPPKPLRAPPDDRPQQMALF